MEFKELQKKMINTAKRYGEEYNIKIDEDFALLKLYEEVGEFAQAVLIHRKQSRPEKFVSEEESKEHLGQELADIMGMTVLNANLLGIDLEGAVVKKWIERKQ